MPEGRKRVLLLVDFKFRDLPGMVLLKSLLERRGPYDAVLAPHIPSLGEDLYIGTVRPHMVVFPRFVSQAHSDRARRLKAHGIGVAVMPAEGQHFTVQGRLQMAGTLTDLDAVDLFFVWNRGIFELVREHRTIAPDKCILGGVPRFDFYHPRFRTALESREQFCQRYDLDPRRPIVTWATNFGWPHIAHRPDLIREAQVRYGREGIDYDVAGTVRADVRSRELLAAAVFRMARTFRDVNFVIKLHPSEESSWYEKAMSDAGVANMRLVPREYIWHVLNATDIHLHRSCTTSLEAWLLDKPTIDLQMVPGEWLYEQDMTAGGDVARSYEDVVERLDHYLGGGEIPPDQLRQRPEILEWFAGPRDGRSAERHVDAIVSWLEQHDAPPSVPSGSYWDWRNRATTALKPLLGLRPQDSIRRWWKGEPQDPREKYFSPEDVASWSSAVERSLGGPSPLQWPPVTTATQR